MKKLTDRNAEAALLTAQAQVESKLTQADVKLQAMDQALADTAQTEARLAPFRGATFPAGTYINGVQAVLGFLDLNDRPMMWMDPTSKWHFDGGISVQTLEVLSNFALTAATITALTTSGLTASTGGTAFVSGVEAVPLVQDTGGRVALALGTDGRLIAPAGIVAPNTAPAGMSTDADGVLRFNDRRISSSRDLYRVGDSLSDGNNSTVLTTGTGRLLDKNAVGGQDSTEIAARVGAYPVYGKPAGNSIPASGAVAVTIVAAPTTGTPGVGAIDLLRHTGDRSMNGWLGGVYGTLSRTGGVPNNAVDLTRYTFTRQTAGAAVATDATRGVQFVPDTGDMLNRTMILWSGNNNYFDPERIKRDLRATIATLKALKARFVVLTLFNGDFQGRRKNDSPNTDYQTIINFNAWLMQEYPRNALDIRTLMPRTADTDVVDPAYRVDGIHLNNAGNDLVDTHIKRFLEERGW